jgi:hypothetical protein
MKSFAIGIVLLALLLAAPAFAQSAHSVTLSWTISPDAGANPALTYNVYRAPSACPAAGPPANQVKIGSASVLTFQDTSVSIGQVYCYTVRSALNGSESLDSNTAAAVILPSPPANLTVTAK